MKKGDVVTGDKGMSFEIGELIAVQGWDGCTDVRCSRMAGKCIGWHCPYCGKPCSLMGHPDCTPEDPE